MNQQIRPIERLQISAAEWAALVDHLRSVHPAEGCGLLAVGADDERVTRRYALRNIAEQPRRRYLAEPRELLDALLAIEAEDWRLGAIYHSHPSSRAWPSDEDVRSAYYPSALTLIVSLEYLARPAAGLFAIRDGQVSERPLLIDAI